MGTVRRGLPRRPGGEPWPPAGFVPAVGADGQPGGPEADVPVKADEPAIDASAPGAAAATSADAVADLPAAADMSAGVPTVPAASSARPTSIRRGLPRVPGGEPWPPETALPAPVASADGEARAPGPDEPSPAPGPDEPSPAPGPDEPSPAPGPDEPSPAPGPDEPSPAPAVGRLAEDDAPSSADGAADLVAPLRRGLPRVPGGEPWPPAAPAVRTPLPATRGEVAPADAASDGQVPASVVQADVVPGDDVPAGHAAAGDAPSDDVPADVAPAGVAPVPSPAVPAKPASTKPVAGAAVARSAADGREPRLYGPYTAVQLAGVALVGALAILAVAGAVVLGVRWFLGLDVMRDFLARYPGEYPLPESAPVGFPAWVAWQHFFNAFLLVLIIQTGIRIRREQRPPAYWASRRQPGRKISLSVWLHQSLDVLWLVNGVVFVVLLVATGHWMRIVPTSWEVFPNAASAMLQYLSLDWPTENGWVNYNALQQLAYFTTVFVAAPLAALTGWRMGSLWPARATALDRAFPLEWARRTHFPVMIYFVAFIAVHVTLVLATGALRNLNHMYAAQGSPDPDAYAANWAGFWIFVASLVVTVAAAVAARPSLVAPIAGMFGKVSRR